METEKNEIEVEKKETQSVNESNEQTNNIEIPLLPGYTSLMGSDVQLKILVEGEGDGPNMGEKVFFRYLVRCPETKKLYESRALRTRLGDQDVPPGLELGLRFLKIQSHGFVYCSPKFAYGPNGHRPQNLTVNQSEFQGIEDIPENSAVEFEVFLLGVDRRVPAELTPEERLEEAIEKRKIGNYHWYFGLYSNACRSYGKGLELIDWNVFTEESELLDQAINTAVSIGNNLSFIQMKSKDLLKSKETIIKMLEICPTNVKSLFFAAKCSIELGDFTEAKIALEKAIVEGEQQCINQQELTEIKRTLENLKKMIRQYHEKQKKMFSFMGKKLTTPSLSTTTASTTTNTTTEQENSSKANEFFDETKKK